MKNEIVKPAVAKAANFLSSTLISSDFLNHKLDKKKRVINRQTEPDDNREAELSNPTEKAE